MPMDSKAATLQRLKSKLLTHELEFKRYAWRSQGHNLGAQNKMATEIIKQAVKVKTFADLVAFNDQHFAGGGSDAIIKALDTLI